MSEHNTFDPARYLRKVGQADYLEVKWRLVWLREIHPDAQITTELIAHDTQAKWAMFRAYVSIPGGGSASGHGSEDERGFKEYIEKAETKAIGRALGALGFGTQFADDFDMGEKVVDSPVAPRTLQNAPTGSTAPQSGNGSLIRNPSEAASEKQINWIRGLAKDNGFRVLDPEGEWHLDEPQFRNWVGATHQQEWPGITKGLASQIIEDLKGGRVKGEPSEFDPQPTPMFAPGLVTTVNGDPGAKYR